MSSSSFNTLTHLECGQEVEIKAGKLLSSPSPSSPISEADFDSYEISDRLNIQSTPEKEKQVIQEKETMETNNITSLSNQIENTFANNTMVNFGGLCPPVEPQNQTSAAVQNISQDVEPQTNQSSQPSLQPPMSSELKELWDEIEEYSQQPPPPMTPKQKQFWDDIESFFKDMLPDVDAPIENNNNNNSSIVEPVDEDEDGLPLPLEEQSIALVDNTPTDEEHSESTDTSDCTVPQQTLILNIKKEKVAHEQEEEEEIDNPVLSSVSTLPVVIAYVPSPCDTPGHQHLLEEEGGYVQIIRTESNQGTSLYSRVLMPLPTTSVVVKSELAQNQLRKRKMAIVERIVEDKIPRIEGESFSSSSCVVAPFVDTCFRLPPKVTTIEELGYLNKQLQIDESLKMNMIHKLSFMGGDDRLGKTTNLILCRLIDEIEVGGLLNWDGRGGKIGLKDYEVIIEVIYEAVQRNPQLVNPTNTKIKNCIQVWLKNAGTKRKNHYAQQLQLLD